MTLWFLEDALTKEIKIIVSYNKLLFEHISEINKKADAEFSTSAFIIIYPAAAGRFYHFSLLIIHYSLIINQGGM